jgi:activator of HSP90 ATPase
VNEKILNEWKHGKVKMKKEVGSNFEICDWNGEVCGQIVELVPNEKIVEKWRLKTFPEGHYSEVEMRLRLRTRTKTKARTNENSENDGKDENEEQETIVEVIQRGVPLSFASNVSKFWFKFCMYFHSLSFFFSFSFIHLFIHSLSLSLSL